MSRISQDMLLRYIDISIYRGSTKHNANALRIRRLQNFMRAGMMENRLTSLALSIYSIRKMSIWTQLLTCLLSCTQNDCSYVVFSLKQGRKHMQLIAFPIIIIKEFFLYMIDSFIILLKIHLGK